MRRCRKHDQSVRPACEELCQSCTLSLMASALRNIMSLIYYDDIPCCILKMSAVFYVSF